MVEDPSATVKKYYYKFGDNTNYFDVFFDTTEVIEIKSKDGITLQILSTPSLGNNQGLIEDVSDFTIAS